MSRRFDHWSYAGGNRPTVLPKTFLNFDCFRINDLHIYSLALIGSLVLQLAIFHQSSWSSTFLCRTRISLEKNHDQHHPGSGIGVQSWAQMDKELGLCQWKIKRLSLNPEKTAVLSFQTTKLLCCFFLTCWTWKVTHMWSVKIRKKFVIEM